MQYIVVDPSCSGSGIVNRMDGIIDEKEDKLKEEVWSAANESQRLNALRTTLWVPAFFSFLQERLLSLAKFQLSVLNHALSFPHVKRVVYSTCSIHQQVISSGGKLLILHLWKPFKQYNRWLTLSIIVTAHVSDVSVWINEISGRADNNYSWNGL